MSSISESSTSSASSESAPIASYQPAAAVATSVSKVTIDHERVAAIEGPLSQLVPMYLRVSEPGAPYTCDEQDPGSAVAYVDQTPPYKKDAVHIVTRRGKNPDAPEAQTPLVVVTSSLEVTLPKTCMSTNALEVSQAKGDERKAKAKELKCHAYGPSVAVRFLDEKEQQRFVVQYMRLYLCYLHRNLPKSMSLTKDLEVPTQLAKEDTFESLTYDMAVRLCNVCKKNSTVFGTPFEFNGDQLSVKARAPVLPRDRSNAAVYTEMEIAEEVLPFLPEAERDGFIDLYRTLYNRSQNATGISKVFFKHRAPGERGLKPVPVFGQKLEGGDVCTIVFVPRFDSFEGKNWKMSFELRGINLLFRMGTYVDTVSVCSMLGSADRALNGLELDVPECKLESVAVTAGAAVREVFEKNKKRKLEEEAAAKKDRISPLVKEGRDALGAIPQLQRM